VLDIGSVVNGKYRVVRLLGDGGMGSVYEAQHAVLGTRVALKVLHPELNRRTGLVERFLQEARVSAQIRSTHVVHVSDVDRTADGDAYIVMDLLEGEPLSSVLDRQRRLPVAVACEYTAQILTALEAAHALAVVHRDLKPENVFVTFASGRPVLKLIDFGIAKARRSDFQQKNLTVAGVMMGTAEYMAPEQAYSADKADARSDLYAVGVMLYEMIAGARPVAGDDARVIALKVERGEVVPLVQVMPGTPPELAGLVHRAMAARPELRFASATEMRLALHAAVGGPRTTAAARTEGPRAASTATVELSPAPARRSSEAHGDTIRAAPRSTALESPGYAGSAGMLAPSPVRPAASVDARRRRPREWVTSVALVALPLFIGAGVVALIVGTGTWASSGQTPAAGDPPAPAISASAAASVEVPSTAAPDAAVATAVPTLTPARAGPVPAASPRATPSAVRGAVPAVPAAAPAPAGADAGPVLAFPAALPSALPPFPGAFPSAIPIPSGFPTALPSNLPAVLPSGFPTAFPSVLPAWPATPAEPSPAVPSATPSARSADPAY